ncbi:hypothetical protein JFL43_13505 [Viridibacillus sp. YIM B01967]|uniref:Uncharacterized protein n=1 Tax=Viridibacillus soli TaxID=2798301 RepID=A0ABS1H8V8_9BACL|nr:hypothetical protein [Viridibacillus soli]MBK3495855.1 hypothetical protein [Viridibacillus soli]
MMKWNSYCEFTFNPAAELQHLQYDDFYFDYEGDAEDFYQNIEFIKEF